MTTREDEKTTFAGGTRSFKKSEKSGGDEAGLVREVEDKEVKQSTRSEDNTGSITTRNAVLRRFITSRAASKMTCTQKHDREDGISAKQTRQDTTEHDSPQLQEKAKKR